MLEKYNRYKLLKVFIESPTESFRLRELSRLSKISPASVINYLKEFEREELIKRFVKRDIPFYQAMRDNSKFIQYKKMGIIYELNKSGIIEELWGKLSPEAIILYGSYAKGESIENSDIDIFLIGKEIKINLTKFEKRLNKKVHLMFESDPKNLPKELKNNLVNGVILKGYFKVF